MYPWKREIHDLYYICGSPHSIVLIFYSFLIGLDFHILYGTLSLSALLPPSSLKSRAQNSRGLTGKGSIKWKRIRLVNFTQQRGLANKPTIYGGIKWQKGGIQVRSDNKHKARERLQTWASSHWDKREVRFCHVCQGKQWNLNLGLGSQTFCRNIHGWGSVFYYGLSRNWPFLFSNSKENIKYQNTELVYVM